MLVVVVVIVEAGGRRKRHGAPHPFVVVLVAEGGAARVDGVVEGVLRFLLRAAAEDRRSRVADAEHRRDAAAGVRDVRRPEHQGNVIERELRVEHRLIEAAEARDVRHGDDGAERNERDHGK